VSTDCLKLTTYLGERDRAAGGFLADALLEGYAHHGVRRALLLRGAGGFGLKHHLRTDRVLSLSEDLPLVAIAVDAPERIAEVLSGVEAHSHAGLVTVERARVLGMEVGTAAVHEQLHEETRLTVFLGRRERAGGRPAFVAVTDLLRRHGLAGATVLLGVDGSVDGARRRARLVGRNADVPVMVVAVGQGARMAPALAELHTMLERPLVTLERVTVCRRDGSGLAPPPHLPARDPSGLALWQKLSVYASEDARWAGAPLHMALVRRLRGSGVRGVTSLRGIWGFHGDHRPHGDRLAQLRRHVPMVTVVVDTPERVAAAFGVVEEVTADTGLVTVETVPALTAAVAGDRYGGLRLAANWRPT
jgi:PII-like signaling protein